MFINRDIVLSGIEHGTMLESRVLESHRSHGTGALAEQVLHLKMITYEAVHGKGTSQIGLDEVPFDYATEYAAEDADVMLYPHRTLFLKVAEDDKLCYVYEQIEIPAPTVL